MQLSPDCRLIHILKQDMSHVEDLTVKCKTLTYDLERMRSLHSNEAERSASAEREMNLHKSKLAYVSGLLFMVHFF